MFSPRALKRLSLPLAIFVLVGMLMPPLYEHAHAEGDEPHDHRISHLTHGPSVGDGGELDRRKSGVWSVSAAARHRHVSWLGLELVVPAPADEGDQPQDEPPVVLVQLLDGPFSASPASSSAASLKDAPVAPIESTLLGSTLAASLAGRARFHRPPPVLWAPLCDAARHERSGVQLS